MGSVISADCQIHYEAYDSGAIPLLLIPGMGLDSRMWGALPQSFGKDFTVITFDPRGTGNSTNGEQIISMDLMAADLIAICDDLGFEKVNLCGVSFGGVLAQFFAIHYPERLNRMILVSSRGEPTAHSRAIYDLFETLLKMLEPVPYMHALSPLLFSPKFFASNSSYIKRMAEDTLMTKTQMQTALAQLSASKQADWSDQLEQIQAQTLLIVGEKDMLMPVEAMESLLVTLPSARLMILPGVGHVPFAEEVKTCINAIRDFL